MTSPSRPRRAAREGFCPVCDRKVGSWHKSGMHPKCVPEAAALAVGDPVGLVAAFREPLGARLTQKQRDDILRSLVTPRRER